MKKEAEEAVDATKRDNEPWPMWGKKANLSVEGLARAACGSGVVGPVQQRIVHERLQKPFKITRFLKGEDV